MCLDPCLGYTEQYLSVALEICRIDRHLVVGSSVTLVLETSCSTSTFMYCNRGSL